MFLDNWYKLLMSSMKAVQSTANSAWNVTVKRIDGTNVTDRGLIYVSGTYAYHMQIFTEYALSTAGLPTIYKISNNTKVFGGTTSGTYDAQYTGVIIGDGDTPPNLSDYCLSGNQITDFTATTTLSVSYNNGKIIGTATYNITNTSASPFTIKEIALTKESANGVDRIMLARSVLETPVTIQPGDTGVVTYKIEIS